MAKGKQSTVASSFDRYEMVAVVVPGTVALSTIGLLATARLSFSEVLGANFGGAALFLIAAFAAGHLIQAIAGAIEDVYRTTRNKGRELIMDTAILAMASTLQPALEQTRGLGDLARSLLQATKPDDSQLVEQISGRAGQLNRRRILTAIRARASTSILTDKMKVNVGLTRGLSVVFSLAASWELLGLALQEFFASSNWLTLWVQPPSWPLFVLFTALTGAFAFRAHGHTMDYELEIWTLFESLGADEATQ